ncbi:MAG: hypothetical protein PHS96_00590 [Anaerolineales bacterium]|nr:hypothetical protein [Anaerolineales bacterium]
MALIYSLHEYRLKPGVDPAQFEAAVLAAQRRGEPRLPGLLEFRLLKGVKGARRGAYAALWVYASRQAWEKLWGSPDHPLPPADYPQAWLEWERRVLAPFLEEEPERLTFTAYQALSSAQWAECSPTAGERRR